MSHKCVRCGSIYEDNDASILRGCKCGSIFFMYIKSAADEQKIAQLQTVLKQKDTTLEQELTKRIDEQKKAEESAEKDEYLRLEEKTEKAEKEERAVAPELKIVQPKSRKMRGFDEIKFGVETVRIPKEGVYEINIDALMRNQPLIILERGSVYFIHLPTVFDKVKE
jgi:predicted  nucleic acid-binding Zn-ribbon protein